MDILHGIEAKSLAVRESLPTGDVMSIADARRRGSDVERPLYTPSIRPLIADVALASGGVDMDATVLYSQVFIDKARLMRHIRQALQDRPQVTLGGLCRLQPLQHGLAELVTYLQLGGDNFMIVVDEASSETIVWKSESPDTPDAQTCLKQAKLPRVILWEVGMAEQDVQTKPAMRSFGAGHSPAQGRALSGERRQPVERAD